MPLTPEALLARVEDALGDKLVSSKIAVGEVTVEVSAEDWLELWPRPCATSRAWPSIS
jgi:hypothetical protein